jgi:hypothetical protein
MDPQGPGKNGMRNALMRKRMGTYHSNNVLPSPEVMTLDELQQHGMALFDEIAEVGGLCVCVWVG